MISIHALHEESDPHRVQQAAEPLISIHALHEESDVPRAVCGDGHGGISIHALHEESDAVPSGHLLQYVLFQSTLSMRRATGPYASDSRNMIISIHALHEESDTLRPRGRGHQHPISIHALHEESDKCGRVSELTNTYFNPRSP